MESKVMPEGIAITRKTARMHMEAGIALVIINNPPVNTLNLQFVRDLTEIIGALEKMEALRCVVLTSAHEKIFIAGYDINEFVSWDKEKAIRDTRLGQELLLKIEHLSKPVICAISGATFGGGLELALACDLRVISANAKVGLPETGLGIIPGWGGTQRLPRLVGPSIAKKLILTAATISAEEAYRIGLAEEYCETGKCLETAMDLARVISKRAPLAVSAVKGCVNTAMESSLLDGMAYENHVIGELCDSKDKEEGVQAFLEKRHALFQNR